MHFNILTLYGPNTDEPQFFTNIKAVVQENNPNYYVICGDFNIIINPDIGYSNYLHINNPRARLEVLSMLEELDLIDIYCTIHPETCRYTWRIANPIKQARLDFFLVSNSMMDIIHKCDVKASYRSDHSIISLEIIQNRFTIGKGVWKFNNNLLKNKDYLKTINSVIDDEILKYATPVYQLEFLQGNYQNISFTINDDYFLEMLLLRMRGETIKFATFLKKKEFKTEKELIKVIEQLESNFSQNLHLLSDKRAELESIREHKLNGQLVCARTQCLIEGEKPSKFFLTSKIKTSWLRQ